MFTKNQIMFYMLLTVTLASCNGATTAAPADIQNINSFHHSLVVRMEDPTIITDENGWQALPDKYRFPPSTDTPELIRSDIEILSGSEFTGNSIKIKDDRMFDGFILKDAEMAVISSAYSIYNKAGIAMYQEVIPRHHDWWYQDLEIVQDFDIIHLNLFSQDIFTTHQILIYGWILATGTCDQFGYGYNDILGHVMGLDLQIPTGDPAIAFSVIADTNEVCITTFDSGQISDDFTDTAIDAFMAEVGKNGLASGLYRLLQTILETDLNKPEYQSG